ncbi:MAG: ABC transporter ATP-binding protein [Deltaproteobacteria bacterium]|nr:ABC transporter ATP-binding protein [Deltaproteobacteria bacterium]
MIRVEGIEVAYGELPVLRDVSLEVQSGEVVGVIGPNGSGKTTLFKAIVGLLKPRKGRIFYDGRRLDGLSTHAIVRRGIVYVPAERELFPQMTVLENLELGAYVNHEAKGELLEFVFSVFPRLKERRGQMAESLSGGEQQMLAIARGVMARPKALLLDEPSTGLAPLLVSEMYRQLSRLSAEGLTILLAEQQVPLALSFSARAYVLENGSIKLSGESRELLGDPEIKRAYLGVA